jgi:hypothetical protein
MWWNCIGWSPCFNKCTIVAALSTHDVAMQLDNIVAPGTLMQTVYILCNERKFGNVLREAD